MKYRLFCYLFLLAIFSLSCGKTPESELKKPEIKVPAESQEVFSSGITFDAGEGNQSQTVSVSFEASMPWSAAVSETKTSSWLSVQPTSGDAGSVQMRVTALPNASEEKRSAKVTIRCETVTKNIIVTQAGVSPVIIAVESVSFSKEALSLVVAEEETLIATILPENATDKTLVWNTSNDKVVTVSDGGRVTAISEGKAIVTAKAGGKEAKCEVTVSKKVVAVERVSLDRTTLTLEEGQSTTLIATVAPENATDKTVTWTSSNENVASVSDKGFVVAKKEGTAVITAKAGEKEASCAVTVKSSVIAVTAISLNKTALNLVKGGTEMLVAMVYPSDATDKSVSWSSNDATVASVSQNGLVTALKSGETTIIAKAGDKSAICTVTVTTPVESVSLDRTTLTLEVGQTTTLTAIISPNDADEKTVTWTSSDTNVASVSAGVVSAISEGSATITASAGGKSATCVVLVKKGIVAVTSVSLNVTTVNLYKDHHVRLVATVSPEDATDKTVTWSSSDATIVSVTQDGKLTALKSGDAIITAKAGEVAATCSVTVTTPVRSVTLDRTSVTLKVGQTTTLTATINPNDADEQTITWESSNTSVATVINGIVTAMAEGSTTITAAVGGKSTSCAVTVMKGVVPVDSVTLNKTSLSLTKRQSETLVATVAPEDATDKTVTWSSSDETIAYVYYDGRVIANKSGNAVITAKAGEKEAACLVTITTPVTSVTLNRGAVALVEGQSTTLIASIHPEDADEQVVVWTSSNTSVATVSNGVVTAITAGNATITASVGDKSAACAVYVERAVIPVESITLNKTSISLTRGQSETLTATVSPSDATNKYISWSSSDVGIASVSQDGQVKALRSGNAVITARAGGKSAACTVTVSTPVESVSLSPSSASLVEGQTITLDAIVYPGDADENTLTWTTSNAGVAAVSDGAVIAISEGVATITASAGGKSATCSILVTRRFVDVTSVTLNAAALNLVKGQSEMLTATVTPSNATDKSVFWSSSNDAVVSVTQAGCLTALKSGTATVTAKAGDQTASCAVTVTTPVESISLNVNSLLLETNHSAQLVATIFPVDADEKDVQWSSSNTSVATVDEGVVTGISEGLASIEVRIGSLSATCLVTVQKEVIEVTKIELNQSSVDLFVGESITLTATVSPDNATDKTVTWTSSNPGIASVDQQGRVHALSFGNSASGVAWITASAGSCSVECRVLVWPIPVTDIVLNKTSLSMVAGETETLSATIVPSNASFQTLIWKSSDTSVAWVDDYGVVKAEKAGQAQITVTSADKRIERTCSVIVQAAQFSVRGPRESLPPSSGTYAIEVTSNIAWSLSIYNWGTDETADWLNASVSSGSSGVTTFTLTADQNDSNQRRVADLVFYYGGKARLHHTIGQNGKKDLGGFTGEIVDWENEGGDFEKE